MEEVVEHPPAHPHDPSDNYCIRADYVAGKITRHDESGDVFEWTEDRIRDSRRYQWGVYELARQVAEQKNHQSVIDIGCGPATKLMHFFPISMDRVGVDQSMAIAHCESTYDSGRFFADDFDDPKLDISQRFDMVVCCDVIEHVENPDSLLAYIKRFCSSETDVVISTPDRDRLRGKDCLFSPKSDHVREWTADEFPRYLESRGFSVGEQRLQLPVKAELSGLFWRHLFAQVRRLRAPAYNQVVVCRVAA